MTSRMAELQRCKSDFQLFRERTNDERRQAAEALSKAKEDAILQTRRAEAAERERNEQQRELDALRCGLKVLNMI